MTEPYRDIVWSPPMRQRGSLASPGGAIAPTSPKWSPHATGMIHPAVVPSFKAPDSFSPITPSVIPPGAYAMTMTKPSLFLIGFGLMLLGICFFSSGFLLGMWMGRGSSSGDAVSQVASASGGGKGGTLSGMGPLLEIIGAAGGNTGRLAYAAQRAVDKDHRQAKSSENTRGGGHTNPRDGTSRESTDGGYRGEGSNRGSAGDMGASPSSGATYAVELGAYATKENALDLMERLRSHSISVYLVESKNNDGSSVFCVRSGSFKDFLMAEAAATALPSDQERITPIVVEVKPADKRLTQP